MTRHWAQRAAERFVPPVGPLSDAEIDGLLPLMNLIRHARGERELSLSAAIEAERVRVESGQAALDAVEVPELIARARSVAEAQERWLRSGAAGLFHAAVEVSP